MNYDPSWNSLRKHHTPEWLRAAKFGIYTHWGIYSVPACGPNVSWYPSNMYRSHTAQHRYHCETYGHPSKFGYKDFIPMFTGENFDPDEWGEIFANSGAKFAGPVAEHHDGFSMWNSSINPWNSFKMGPKRDVVGELEKSFRKKNMKFMVALHHAEQWKFYPHWVKEYDTSDPAYVGLYGPPHNLEWGESSEQSDAWEKKDWDEQVNPTDAFMDTWMAKAKEVVDCYSPELIWFDFGLSFVREGYKKRFIQYFYNTAQSKGQDPIVTYKFSDLPAGCGLIDLELGRFDDLTHMDWITDTTVDDGSAWGYMNNAAYKTPKSVIHYLIDNVSKNGYLLLNVGPNYKGEIPGEAKEILSEMGKWLKINGESIYGTTPWFTYGYGPTKLEKSGAFNEKQKFEYTSEDVRFTTKDNFIYVTCLDWPGNNYCINHLPKSLISEDIKNVTMLGSDEKIEWKYDWHNKTLNVTCPKNMPCKYAYVYRIEKKE